MRRRGGVLRLQRRSFLQRQAKADGQRLLEGAPFVGQTDDPAFAEARRPEREWKHMLGDHIALARETPLWTNNPPRGCGDAAARGCCVCGGAHSFSVRPRRTASVSSRAHHLSARQTIQLSRKRGGRSVSGNICLAITSHSRAKRPYGQTIPRAAAAMRRRGGAAFAAALILSASGQGGRPASPRARTICRPGRRSSFRGSAADGA